MNRAAIYTRISQDRDGAALGVARQEKDCRALAQSKGWTVTAVYQDNDTSATSTRPREHYQRMLADIEAGIIDAVMVWDVDRLTRKPRELEDIIDLANRFKIDLASVGGEIDLATAQGRLIARIKGNVAKHEAEQTSRRAKAKHRERAAKGLPSGGGLRPFGFEEDRITHRETEAEVVREALSLLRNGSTLRAVCRTLNERGALTTTGRQWSTNTLKKVVCGPRVAGFRQHNGELIEAVWEPLVSRNEWEQLRRDLNAGERRTTAAFQRKHTWTGLLTCWRCGGLMGGRRVNGKPTYVCRSSTHDQWDGSRAGGCQGTSIRQNLTEALLDDLLLSRAEMEALGSVNQVDETHVLEEEIAKLEGRLESLADDLAESNLDAEAYRVASRKITEKLGDLRSNLATRRSMIRTQLALDPLRIRSQWSTMSPAEKRALAGAFVDKVIVGPARRGDNRFNPNRLLVVWR